MKVFISYRREDSAYPAQHLYDHLREQFGEERVLFDVDTIPLGIDFRAYLREQVESCDVLLAVIGDRWLTLLTDRLDKPNDFVRVEIELALQANLLVIPVLVGGASVPEERALPSSLAVLPYLNAAELRAGRDRDTHVQRLASGLERAFALHVERNAQEAEPPQEEAARERREGSGKAKRRTEPGRQAHARQEPGGAAQVRGEPPPGAVSDLNKPIWIEGGTFEMGGEDGRENERPVHPVTLSGFWIQEHPVTNEEYKRFEPSHSYPSGQERHPATRVNWQQAMDYARSVGGSLPTEAQWEFAARGTEGRTYPWGEEDPTCERAHYSGCPGGGIGGGTIPVMSRQAGATPEGVHDLAGNVWEWVADRYGSYPATAVTDPEGPRAGQYRVLRGGSFYRVPSHLRGASRDLGVPGSGFDGSGFRVAWPGGQN